MKHLIFTLLASAALITPACQTLGQARASGYGFDAAGEFHFTVSGAANLEASRDLVTWMKYATVAQETGLSDTASRQMDRRFYRIHSGAGSTDLVGFIKVTIPPGKLAVLGNSFASALRLDSAEGRHALFGLTNPPIKLTTYTNGNFAAPHVLDSKTGNWEPRLRPIRPQEGFALQNTGTTPLTLRMSGEVRQGRAFTPLLAGASLVAPPVPYSGPLDQLLTFAAQDGAQLEWFDEQTQSYQVSTFEKLEAPGKWNPKLPDLRPGRAFILKLKQPVTWTNSPPGQVR